jgi:hypothetical protein
MSNLPTSPVTAPEATRRVFARPPVLPLAELSAIAVMLSQSRANMDLGAASLARAELDQAHARLNEVVRLGQLQAKTLSDVLHAEGVLTAASVEHHTPTGSMPAMAPIVHLAPQS